MLLMELIFQLAWFGQRTSSGTFTVSLLALHDITAINLPLPLDKSNSFHSMAIHLLVYSSTFLPSSLLPKTFVATVGIGGHSWNVLVNVQLTM